MMKATNNDGRNNGRNNGRSMRIVKKFVKALSEDFTQYHEYTILPDIGLAVRLTEECGCGKALAYPWRKYADVRKRELQAFARIDRMARFNK